jgi:hypothetical protein
MTLFRLSTRRRKPSAPAKRQSAEAIFRQFFALISRLEKPHHVEAPEIKARITRLGEPGARVPDPTRLP